VGAKRRGGALRDAPSASRAHMNSLTVILDVGLTNGLLFAGAVVALTVAFRLLHFPDITVEGSFPLGAATYAAAAVAGAPMVAAVALAAGAGAAAGAATAVLHSRFRLNKFLAGIIVVSVTYSVMLRVMRGPNVGLLSHANPLDSARAFGVVGGMHLGMIGALALAVGAACVALVLLLVTRAGSKLRAVGSNPTYARAIGLNTSVYLAVGLAVTNALAALAGVGLAMNQGFADVSLGQGVLVLCLAAMTLGEVTLPQRLFRSYVTFIVTAGVVGSLLFQCVTVWALRAGVSATDLKLATAAVVLVLVAARLTTDRSIVAGREFE
jgi:putative ABC transport system permease protein